MKNIFKFFLAATLFTGLASCEDEQDLIYVTPEASFSILTPVSGEGVILSADAPQNPALVLAWQDMNYGTPVEVTYTVQMVLNGNDFSSPVNLTSTTNTYTTINAQSLNSAVLGAGLVPGEEGAIDIRIKSNVGTQPGMEAYSDTITYLVTPYQLFTAAQNLYLVGAATEHGWENNNGNAPLFRDPDDQNIFYFTGYFNADEFKVLSSRGNWHPQYGSASEGVLGVSGDDGSNEPGPFVIETAGYYTLTMNIGDMTYTLEPFSASGANTFDSVGIIGAATPGGWDTDTNLTNSTQNPHLWRLASVELTDDVVKFRANDSWDLPGNWGGGTLITGQMTENGSDFQAVPLPGTYEVWFNDLDLRYIFIEI